MNNVLHISKPYLENIDDKTRMIFDLRYPTGEYSLYFEVDQKFGKYFATELSDSCVVCVLMYAMEHNLNIESEGPISERIYNQLNRYLIPAISTNISKYKPISINSDTVDIHFCCKGVGAGLSCGVDSFYSILKNLEHSKKSKLRLTHLCFFNAGATGMYGGEEARNVYLNRGKRFKTVAQNLGCEFLMCDSNMNEFLMQEHEMTHVVRTLSIPLALQKLFSVYYFASSYKYSEFKFHESDMSYYDILTLPLLSNQNIRFELVGAETTRQGKVNYISKFDITKKELNVCINGVENCCSCRKCKRTMLNLFNAGVLDEYTAVFNVTWFKQNQRKLVRWALLNFWRVDMGEIIKDLRHNKKIRFYDYLIVAFEMPFYLANGYLGKMKFHSSIHSENRNK